MKTLARSIIVLILGMGLALPFFGGFKIPREKEPVTHTVIISQMKFNPDKLTVKKGDKIIWKNKDIVLHDVTQIDKKWTSGPLKPGESWSKTVTANFDYFCSIHVVMKASVVVGEK